MVQTLAVNAGLPVLLGASPFYRTPNAPLARGLALTPVDFVRARLTAMAVESRHFTRDDIYTLFVTTRIINFLKGLPVDGTASLAELLERSWPGARTEMGIELLIRLLRTKKLYLWTADGLIENRRFKRELFETVLAQAGVIGCINGGRIQLENF
jgi:hypothetical protein